ncbi:MAG: type II CAAX endopeptidase family protein [Polyangiaceae bacterium]|nr:type II CAAX endopeptidase family protein [Polyangiaceae bacterium]
MARWGRVAAMYTLIAIPTCVLLAILREGSPLLMSGAWLTLPPAASHTCSLLLGLAFGSLVAAITRPMVLRLGWAKELHSTLRPFARGLSRGAVVCLAILSAICEELLFRGLLQPWLGLLPQAVLFGLVHQVPGKSRWVWVAWATLMGALLGSIFQLTGSLVGAVAAHALINGFNLSFLKHHDTREPRRRLGGLLGQM